MSGFDLVQNPDGANFQAQAVLAYMRYHIGSGIDGSWDDEKHQYTAKPRVTRHDNGREQGYVVWLRSRDGKKQINIAFYEHRNSDEIHAVVSHKRTLHGPVLADITEVMSDKWDTTKSVDVGAASDLAEWIVEQLTEFWAESENDDYPDEYGRFNYENAWDTARKKMQEEAARKAETDAWQKAREQARARDDAFARAQEQAREQARARPRSSAPRSWWEVLGVNRYCTEAVAKAAYRRLALKHHPDKNGGDAANTLRMQEINAAWTEAQRNFKNAA